MSIRRMIETPEIGTAETSDTLGVEFEVAPGGHSTRASALHYE